MSKITQGILNRTGYRLRLLHYSVTHPFPVGVDGKTFAEFVIALHDESKTLPEFKQKLKDAGADFPDSFVENMD